MLYLLLNILFIQCLLSYVKTDWPSPSTSNVQLLGLFSDLANTSQPTTYSVHSRAMFQAALILSQQYNITIEGQFIGWQSKQTGGDAINALSDTCLAISSSNIVGIVGPEFSSESQFIAPFAGKIGIPVISPTSTDPELSDRSIYPAFYRTVPSDNIAAVAIVDLFIRFNWTSCIIIYQNDAFGSGGAKAITDAFDKNNLTVISTIVFDIVTFKIRGNLQNLLTSSATRIVILWAASNYASVVLQNALEYDVVGPRFAWILSSDIPVNSFNQTWYDKLSGLITFGPIVGNIVKKPFNATLLNAAYQIWQEYEPESFPGSDNVSYYALFAFDATWTLIQALKQLCSKSTKEFSSCVAFYNNSFCFDRRFLNSNAFFDTITNNTFLGVSGLIQFSKNVTDRIKGDYYVAKNLQRCSNGLTYVPVLVWSDSNGWTLYPKINVIVWPGYSLVPPFGYTSVSGVVLRVAIVNGAPYTMVREITDDFGQTTLKLSGYVPDLVDHLADIMKFIPNFILVPTNQTYNELIDALVNGVYDIIVADMTITAARREKVGFSASIFDNSLRIIIRKEDKNGVDLWSYLKPFSLKLWMTLLSASIFAGFLICLLEGQKNEVLKDRSISSVISMSMWYSIGTLLGYGADFQVTTAAGRLLTLGLYILCLVSVAAYTAKLVSALMLLKPYNIVSGIDDIKNGKVSFDRIGILVGTAMEDYYLREISGGVRNYYPLQTIQEMYDGLLNNIIDASILDAGILEYATNNVYCNLTVVGADFAQSAFGIVFPKKWQYAQELDVNILTLREAGTLDDLRSEWFQAAHCSQSSASSKAMKIESMVGLYLTFTVICILAFLLFIWTKRFAIKDYLRFKLGKNLLFDGNVSLPKDSIQTVSEHLSASESDRTIYL